MRLKVRNTTISIIFLSTFLFLRIVNLHAFSHFSEEDETPHCELCEIIAASQQDIPFFDQAFVLPEQKPTMVLQKKERLCEYDTSHYCITLPRNIYNKPPPVSLG
ncbi:hypothetical protein [Aquimarina sp. I32.4]|uniref:hypothetical protein n=1 Tax=Aquimarina sp. I32.4 TaxID=2053903 RepID=UPI000CDE891B|nr:hypothetical protein [Aquimarina sp. I32.4]